MKHFRRTKYLLKIFNVFPRVQDHFFNFCVIFEAFDQITKLFPGGKKALKKSIRVKNLVLTSDLAEQEEILKAIRLLYIFVKIIVSEMIFIIEHLDLPGTKWQDYYKNLEIINIGTATNLEDVIEEASKFEKSILNLFDKNFKNLTLILEEVVTLRSRLPEELQESVNTSWRRLGRNSIEDILNFMRCIITTGIPVDSQAFVERRKLAKLRKNLKK